MTVSAWLFVLTAGVAGLAVYIWLSRQTKLRLAKSDQQTRQTFDKRWAYISAISSLSMGGLFVAAMLINWRTFPAENYLFAAAFIAFGVGAVVYGTYKLYEARR